MAQESIDVAIPTLNSAETLDNCLRSIKDNIPVKNIIVVDGGSTDDTIKIAKSYGAKIVHDPGPLGKVTYLQAELTDGEWFLQISSDVEVYANWWANIKDYMDDDYVALITVLGDADIRPKYYAEYSRYRTIKHRVGGCVWLLRRPIVLQCKDSLENVHVQYDEILENCIRQKGLRIILIEKKLFYHNEDFLDIPPRAYKTGQSMRLQYGLSLRYFLRCASIFGWVLKSWVEFVSYKSSIKWWLDIRLPIYLLYLQLWTLAGYIAGSKRWKNY